MKRNLACGALIFGVLTMAGMASAARVTNKPAVKSAPARAATAGIRVSCDGDSDGAMVTINGVFKGQCPIDIKIAPGNIKLKVYQKVDASRDRAFFAEFLMAEDTMKKVDVVLGPPLTAGEMDEYARTAPERARAAAQALQRARAAETDKLAAAAAQQEKLQNSWRKINGEWGDVQTDHDEGCTRLQDHMHRYIKQERNFSCSCDDVISNHPAHRGSVFTTCKATWDANLVINDTTYFIKRWSNPRTNGTGEHFEFSQEQ